MNIYLVFSMVLMSSLISMALIPILKKYAIVWGLVDKPSERRIHSEAIPRCGGIAVFIATHLAIGGFILISNACEADQIQLWVKLLISSGVLFIIGLYDDKYSLPALWKLAGQLAVSILMFIFGYSFGSMLGQPLPEFINFFLTIFWFILLMNAFNLIDGMDGICAGLGIIASFTIGLICLYLGNVFAAVLLMTLAGACLGFLRYNFNPATIFLGDSGSLFIGFIIAAISLETNLNKSTLVSILIPLMIAGVPIFDVFLAVVRRVSRTQLSKYLGERKKSKIFGPDLDHLHHRLLKLGFSQRKVALFIYAAAGVASLSVLISIFTDNFSLAILLVGLLILLNIIFRKVVHLEVWTIFQWILKASKRPIGFKRIFIHIFYDLFVLVTLTLITNQWFGFNHHREHLLILFGGVLFPFLMIKIFGNYKVIWSRARPWQFWKLNIEIILGEFLYFIFLVTVVEISEFEIIECFSSSFQFHITRLALMSGLIVISRLSPLIIRDLSSWMRRYQTDESHFKTLIIGSGYELGAYLRRAAYRNSHVIQRKIIGILENEILDSGTLVFGYPVMGKYEDLNKVLAENEITEIIICDDLYIEKFKYEIEECKNKGIVIKHYISDVKKI